MTLEDMLLRMLLAMVAGGAVGMEREQQDRPAGLRTHILVCVGSALITIISFEVAEGRGDPGRIAAQIVTGIGFLGAGTIFRYGTSVRGLTTAAGLWMTAGIGMAVGIGGNALYAGLIGAAVIVILNQWIRVLEKRWLRLYQEISFSAQRGVDVLTPLLEEATRLEMRVQRIEWLADRATDHHVTVRLRLRLPARGSAEPLVAWLVAQEGVSGIEYE